MTLQNSKVFERGGENRREEKGRGERKGKQRRGRGEGERRKERERRGESKSEIKSLISLNRCRLHCCNEVSPSGASAAS